MKRLGANAYHLALPDTLAISLVFNVEDFTAYPSSSEAVPPVVDSLVPPPILPTHAPPREQIEAILDDQLVFTHRGGYQKFLVRWKGRSPLDDSWVKAEEVQCLNPDLYDDYLALHSTELSSFLEVGD